MKKCISMRTDDFNYDLPEELIAQNPPEHRGTSRMLVLDPATSECKITTFDALADYLESGDTIAVNDTKVIRARLFAKKDTGAEIEIFLLGLVDQSFDRRWHCMMRNAKRLAPGSIIRIYLADKITLSEYAAKLIEKRDDGTFTIEFITDDVDKTLRLCGHLPLPPYIKRDDAELDSERYQTIYAATPGAVAAPTAGLHFTDKTFEELKQKNIIRANLTLHVGAGTFKPVSVDNVQNHKMHFETYFLNDDASEKLNTARKNNKRILAVGTTSLRTLETCVDQNGMFAPRQGETDIFIYPPYRIKSADMLLTNFHLPKSTLLMLVSAFAGFDNIMKAYNIAIENRMRFFSYGDCMLILNKIKGTSKN